MFWIFIYILGSALIASNALAADVADSESVFATDATQDVQIVESELVGICDSYYNYYDYALYNNNLCDGNMCSRNCSCASGTCNYYCAYDGYPSISFYNACYDTYYDSSLYYYAYNYYEEITNLTWLWWTLSIVSTLICIGVIICIVCCIKKRKR